ncbi:aldo/keto reductase [Xylariaceae sp. FL0255]|nr:aldo/keto reductase [Xylariaceae sp. FL0255]
MSFLPKAPPPKSPLGRYRLLSPTAAVRVSPLCLGAMNFGDAWKENLGGGNFIDTANNYQNEESEIWIGEWMKERGVRDQIVLATKYTTNFRLGHLEDENCINFQGNGTKSLYTSLKASLAKFTSIPEVMQSFNAMVNAGKVLYLGVSDTPAWFSVYQGRWSAASRDFERKIIPIIRDEGIGICPWGALGGSKFKTEEQFKAATSRSSKPTELDLKINKVLENVAGRKSSIITSIAQAYVIYKAPYIFPIVGGRSVDHLKANIEALNLALTEEDIKEIESAVPFELGFPSGFLYPQGTGDHPGKVYLLNMGGTTDYVGAPSAIVPRKGGE